jgi:hypothetical protein
MYKIEKMREFMAASCACIKFNFSSIFRDVISVVVLWLLIVVGIIIVISVVAVVHAIQPNYVAI